MKSKKSLSLLSFLLCFYFGITQVLMPATSIGSIERFDLKLGTANQAEIPLLIIDGRDYASVLALVSNGYDRSQIESKEIIVGAERGGVVTLKVPIELISELEALPGIEYLELSTKISPNLERAVRDARVDSVHQGLDLPSAFTGRDVLIGITDWGFDYTHPMFYDTTLTESRILAAWDQYKTSGPAPAGYTYGTEYDTPEELLAAKSDTANIYSYATHGSHVAGIAAGSGAGTKYRGVAFDAQYLFATFLVDEGAVLDAFEWMYQKSLSEDKRLVINMSWGLYYFGTLDGNSLVSRAIDEYSSLGVVFVTSGGNNGDSDFHIKHEFAGDTLRSRINFVPNNAVNYQDGQSITAWGNADESFAISFDVLDITNQLKGSAPIYFTNSSSPYTENDLIIGSDTFHYDIAIESAHPLNNRSNARLRIDFPPSGNKIVLKSTAASGTVHYWNVLETTTGVGNTGWDFSSLGVGYIAGDRKYGIGEPACTKSAISVGSHQAGIWNNNEFIPFNLSGFSSQGPTLDERRKPDLTAPGGGVISSISSYTDGGYTPVSVIEFNDREYGFIGFSGTSMSSPMVAGIAALMLEANPDMTSQMVKDVLLETAREDQYTGNLADTGNNFWGFGKAHAFQAMKRSLELLAVEEVSDKPIETRIFPNPTKDVVNFKSTMNEIWIYDLEGRMIDSQFGTLTELNISNLASGVYILMMKRKDKNYIESLVVD
jgi:minor extracellular serine protease Vpr